MGILGIIAFILLTYLLSRDKKNVSFRVIAFGLALQFLFALLILGIPSLGVPGVLAFLFQAANAFFIKVIDFTDAGSRFLFGPLIDPEQAGGWIFAFRVLPTIIFFSSLMAILYYLGIMQRLIQFMAMIMRKTLGISGAEALATASNVFVGQTEAPLVVRPYIKNMTKSELLVLMTGGMATVAGGVLAAFVGLLSDRIPDIGGHLLTASVMSAPAAVMIAKVLYPERERPVSIEKDHKIEMAEEEDANMIEAAARGAGDGLKLALNVAAMLLAFIALIALANWFFEILGNGLGFPSWGKAMVPEVLYQNGEAKLSLEVIFSWVFAPVAFLMGVPWAEAPLIGALLGKKIILNEFVAYIDLSKQMQNLSDKSIIIASYALCGFANFSSIGIQIGGIGGIAPSRRSELARFGLMAVYGGSIAAFLTASIAGLLL